MYTIVSTMLTSLVGAVTRDEEEFVTELRHVPDGWLAVGALSLLALLCWAVMWMYRFDGRRGASPRVRVGLGIIRCMVIVMLAIVLLEPVRVRILRRWIDSYTVVLVDDSSSMGLTDRYRDEASSARVQRVLEGTATSSVRRSVLAVHMLGVNDNKFLRELADRNRIKLYTFSDEPQLLATIRASREEAAGSGGLDDEPDSLFGVRDIKLELSATGSGTNIERAVRRAVESVGGAPIAGVVILSDGGFNQGASVEETARFASDRDVPLYVVGIGDPASPQNVRVTEVLAPPNAFQLDPFSISARLAAEGIDGQSILVRLLERNTSEGGRDRIVASKSVTVQPGGAIAPVTFERSQSRVGRFVYTVEVPVLENESVADDNSRQTTVNVINSRTRVLIVSGGPSWDYRFLSRLLERDKTIDVSCWLQSADLSAVRDGNTIIDHLPATAEELFEYDVVVLLDPDGEEFDEEWCKLVDTFVTDYGGGLLYGAARARTPMLMRDKRLKPLLDLLPVVFDPEADIVLNDVGHYQVSPASLEIPSQAMGHPIVQLAGDPVETRRVWERVRDVYWHFPVLRAKPVATVLMRHGHPRMRNPHGAHVLGAVQYVGAGRTGFLGIDSTWRWRRYGIELFDRFWIQFVRYLAEGKLLGGTKRGMLLTESEEFAVGEAVTVSARLLDRQYRPLNRDQVLVQYEVDGERGDLILGVRADRPGWFEGRFVPDRTGSYRLSMKMPDPTTNDPVEVVREIRVTRPNLEILRPQMDRAKLMVLADQSHGGQYFEIDEAVNIPGLIPDLHEEIAIRSRPTTLWDNWIVLTFLLSLLCLEWGVRKWHRML